MEIISEVLDGVIVISPRVYTDERGHFFESYSKKVFESLGLNFDFVQDNHSFSRERYTLRGLHLQGAPFSQSTLVRVLTGTIKDFVVDLRVNSPTFGSVHSELLSAENNKQLLIPRGFAHGFLTLTKNVHMLYKMDTYYCNSHEIFINPLDPDIGIDIPVGVDEIVISDRDKNAPLLRETDLFSS